MTFIAAQTKAHDLNALFLRTILVEGTDEDETINFQLSMSGGRLILHVNEGDERIAIESLPLTELLDDWLEQIMRNHRIRKKHEEARKRQGLEG